MSAPVLLIGATGTIGGATIDALRAVGTEPVAFVRDAGQGAAKLGDTTQLRVGDLADESTVRAALEGIDRVLLCSGHHPAMREHQLKAVRAIASSDVRRVVKISGSPVSMTPNSPARTGRDHLAVEEALRAVDRETVAIQPNTFMQNLLDQAIAVGHGALPGPDGLPRVSFVDARDVGRVAAAVLTADATPEPVLEVTGPEALTWFDVAQAMTTILGRTITHYPAPPDIARQGLLALGRPDWLVDHLLELGALMSDPKAAEITDAVERITGQRPVTLAQFLKDHAAEFPPAT